MRWSESQHTVFVVMLTVPLEDSVEEAYVVCGHSSRQEKVAILWPVFVSEYPGTLISTVYSGVGDFSDASLKAIAQLITAGAVNLINPQRVPGTLVDLHLPAGEISGD